MWHKKHRKKRRKKNRIQKHNCLTKSLKSGWKVAKGEKKHKTATSQEEKSCLVLVLIFGHLFLGL